MAKPGEGFQPLCERQLARGLLLDGHDVSDREVGGGGASRGLGGLDRYFGDYVLEEELGHGGMGVVYRAWQRSLQRTVAIKFLLLGRHASPGAVERFLREAEAVARLRHPGIVTVYEVGQHDGHHYFTLEYVEGRTLAEVLREGPLVPRRSAGYGCAIAEAVAFAHAQGIVHRDLKPSNVLLDGNDRPRVLDFGVAKRLDEDQELTSTGEVLGSPAYLSPEQAGGRHREVGFRSDVYSLGAMLYETLTGRPPFLAASVADTLACIRDRLPVTPRRLNPGIPVDLESIVLKCLEKDPAGRYESGQELAADLKRFLAGEPTLARPIGTLGLLHRWVRRRPKEAAILVLAVVTAVVATTLSVRLARAERATAWANTQLASNLRRLRWQEAEEALSNGRSPQALSGFARLLRDQPGDTVLANRLASLLSRRAFAIPVGLPMAHAGPVHWVEFDPGGERLLTGSADGAARLWESGTGRLLQEFHCGGPVVRASFCSGGSRVLTVLGAGTVGLWRVEDGHRLMAWSSHEGNPVAVTLAAGGSRFAITQGLRAAQVIDAASGEPIAFLPAFDGRLSALELSPDGRLLAVGDAAGRIWMDLVEGWGKNASQGDLVDEVTVLAFRPDGGGLLAGSRGGTIALFDVPGLGAPRLKTEASGEVVYLRWSPTGTRAMVGRFGEWPELWDLTVPRVAGVFDAVANAVVMDAAWGPRGDQVLLAYRSGVATLFDPETQQPIQEPFEHGGPIVRLAFGSDSTQVATASHDGTARTWDLRQTPASVSSVEVLGRVGPGPGTFRGCRVITVTRPGETRLADAITGETVGIPLRHGGPVTLALLSPDGSLLATGGAGVQLWDPGTGECRAEHWGPDQRVTAMAWAPDSAWIAAASKEGQVRRWSTRPGTDGALGLSMAAEVSGLEVSPDGRRMVALCRDSSVRVVDVASGTEVLGPLRHWGRVWTAEFTSDSRRLVTASMDRTVRIWDMATGHPVVPPMRHEQSVLVARFSPDGRIVASGAEDRTVRLWDAATGRLLTPPLRHPDRVWILAFSGDGRRLLTAADRGDVRVWDVESGMPLTEPLRHDDMMLRAWFDPNGRSLSTVTHHGVLTHWSYSTSEAPPPAWLPRLAEALAGHRVNDLGETEPAVMDVLGGLAQEVSGERVEGFYGAWGRWYLSARQQGLPAP